MLAAVAFILVVAPASANDYASTARNIIPSGQYGSVPPPAGADVQAQMYDALTPRFDQVTDADLLADFKSEAFGVGPDGPARPESVPHQGVTILRDRYDVPHITGKSRDDVTWAMGWVLEEDRGLLLAEARGPARLAAIDAPNIYAFGLIANLKTYTPTKQVDRMIDRAQTRALRSQGAAGRAVLHDIDVYLQGLNARLRFEKSAQKPWTRVDIYSANATIGQIFGQGGGDEARRSQYLGALREQYGTAKGDKMFDDVSEFDDQDTPATIDKSFPYDKIGSGKGSVVLDPGSLKLTGPTGLAQAASAHPNWASNFEIISGSHSTSGHPLFVGGPQIGYFYPGLTEEADLKWPGGEARGATAPGFAGNILIGRGQDYAWSLTSAGSDLIDTFAETLCGGSKTRYLYKGKCRTMGRVDAGVIKGSGRVVYNTTVHGPVTGYAKVHGKTVALSRQRASFGRDVLWQLPFRDLTTGKVRSAKTFIQSMARSPFTFNAGYADDRDIAMFSAGRLPLRDPRTDPRLPTKGTGQYEWRGFLSTAKHPQTIDPPSGEIVNWNNDPARGWPAADDNWAYGSVQRVNMIKAGLARQSKQTLPTVVSAMNAAATTDLRSFDLTPVLTKLLAATPAPSARSARMLALLQAWDATGSSRLDRDLNGFMDAGPAPVIWDALWPHLQAAALPIPGLTDIVGLELRDERGLHRRRLLVRRQGPQDADRDHVQVAVLAELLPAGLRGQGVGGVRGGRQRPAGGPGDRRPGCLEVRRDEGADHLQARAAADHDPLHQPPERHPAGDQLQRAPPAVASPGKGAAAGPPRPLSADGPSCIRRAPETVDVLPLTRTSSRLALCTTRRSPMFLNG